MLEPLFFSSFLKNSLFWRILNIEVDDSYYEPPMYPSLNLSNNGVSCIYPFYIILFVYFLFLALSGLSCGTRELLLPCAGSSQRCVGFSLVVAHGLQSTRAQQLRCTALQLWCAGSRAHGLCSCGTQALQLWCTGLVAPQHVGSQLPDQGSNPCHLHWKMDS